jgi:hypothetical protein
LALSVPLSRFTSQVGGGSAFFVRRLGRVLGFAISDLKSDVVIEFFYVIETFASRVAFDAPADSIRGRSGAFRTQLVFGGSFFEYFDQAA